MTIPTKPIIDGPGEYAIYTGQKIKVRGRDPDQPQFWVGELRGLDSHWNDDGTVISGNRTEDDIIGKWTEPTPPDAPSYEELAAQLKVFREALLSVESQAVCGVLARDDDEMADMLENCASIATKSLEGPAPSDLLATHEARIRAEEREACARYCETHEMGGGPKSSGNYEPFETGDTPAYRHPGHGYATAIRARSEGEGDE